MLNSAPKWHKLMPEIPNVWFSCGNSNIRDLLQILATEIQTNFNNSPRQNVPKLYCSSSKECKMSLVFGEFHWIRPDIRCRFEDWCIGYYGNRRKSEDVLQQVDASVWDKSGSNDEFSSDEVDSDIDDPNVITQYHMPTHPTPHFVAFLMIFREFVDNIPASSHF
jgi:hypothetical protein